MAYGYVDDRAGATAALPPFSEHARKTGKCSLRLHLHRLHKQLRFLQLIGKEVEA